MAYVEEKTLVLETKEEEGVARTLHLINLICSDQNKFEFTSNLYAMIALQALDTVRLRNQVYA